MAEPILFAVQTITNSVKVNKIFTITLFYLLTASLAACSPSPIPANATAARTANTVTAPVFKTFTAESPAREDATRSITRAAAATPTLFPSPAPAAAETASLTVSTTATAPFVAIAFTSPGGLNLATSAEVFHYQDGKETPVFTWPETIQSPLMAFSANGMVLASRLNNGDVVLLDTAKGEIFRTLRLGSDFTWWPYRLALSDDGVILAAAEGENAIDIWNIQTGERLAPLSQPGSGVTYQSLVFSPDGKSLAGGFMNTVTLWDVSAKASAPIHPGCRSDTVFDLAFSLDGKYLSIACGANGDPVGFLAVWDIPNHQNLSLKEEIRQQQHIVYSPKSDWMASIGPDGLLMLWDASAEKDPIIYKSRRSGARDLTVSPDGSSLAIATEDSILIVRLADIIQQP